LNIDHHQEVRRSGLKVVCDECGNLSIKAIDPNSAPDMAVHCRRCNAVRGTVADLRELARRSTDAFEF
jgi:ribosomal protein S27E